MKIRNGFVSNSSSSSFIVHGVKIAIEDYEKLGVKNLDGLILEEDRHYFSGDSAKNYIVGKSGGWLEDGAVTKLQWLTDEEKTELIEKLSNIGINIAENQIETYIQFISNDNY